MKIAVLGAGINGVSTGLAIQERIENSEVTIISANFSPNTTSDVAAGLIEPYLCSEKEEKIIKWTKATISRIQEYMAQGNPGAQEMSGYWMQSKKLIPKWLEVMRNVKVLSGNELEQVARRPEHKYGIFYTTWYLEPTAYIAWSTKNFLKNGGKFKTQKLISIEDVEELAISDNYDLVINCTGLGSRELFGDLEVVPVRGQVMRVRCPAVKHWFMDDDYYALLNDNCIILGGTKEPSFSLTIDDSTASNIFHENCVNLPALKTSEILSHHVGLRPSRSTVRLELDLEHKVPIIHNYGHGGSGITLHWGCALDVVALVERVRGGAKL